MTSAQKNAPLAARPEADPVAGNGYRPGSDFPVRDRFFEIRFESIGGLGAHAAGQILAGAAVLRLGLNGAHFSSYGSEKKGSVVRSFVRLGLPEKPIRTSSPVESPDAVVIFHGALLRLPTSLAGLRAGGTLIYNAPPGPPPPELARLPKDARVIRVDALGIAIEEKSRPNAVLLGTLTAAYPFLKPKVILAALAEEFAGKHADAVASNERAYLRGGSEYEILEGVGRGETDLPIVRPGPVWGYETAPAGGVIPRPGNSAWNDLSASRTGVIPVFHPEACIHCALCDMVCADLCLVWRPEADGAGVRMEGIDYRYCKGCMRCIESCPTGALTREPETPGLADRLRVPLFPDLLP
ncbi:MAG: 4Fe-4S dicluster domain-containing protein [Puniceicoccaceae bacterium]|nr:MAG: 4Fe-4S dicluster domain-containing protein [Puniceicoccaceae bacterium]